MSGEKLFTKILVVFMTANRAVIRDKQFFGVMRNYMAACSYIRNAVVKGKRNIYKLLTTHECCMPNIVL